MVKEINTNLLLQEALKLYGMENCETVFIRHNENITFQVDRQYLLRIHKRVEGFSDGSVHEGLDPIVVRRQELHFLTYLKNCGIRVQTPVPNQKGEIITILEGGIPATMLTWIEGETVEKKGCSSEIDKQIGEMVANMHLAANTYKINENILHYDDRLCGRLQKRLYQVADPCHFSKEEIQSMAGALDVISSELKASKQNAIPVHSDLSLSNILVTATGIVPIDFSLFGYSHPMMDLGGLYCCVNGIHNRRAIAEGYRMAGGEIEYHALDCCFALDILLGILMHCESWSTQDWFQSRMIRWCGETFGPLSDGKRIFSDDFFMLNVL